MFPTGTVTFLFTDIEGSTTLWELHPAAMQAALSRHNAILHNAIGNQDGQVFKMIGDAFQAAFAHPTGALLAAIDAQRSLAKEEWSETGQIKVRMGIHTGEAQLDESGDYAVSHTLNRAARISSAGHGGQILISLATAELLRDRLPEGVQLIDKGHHTLKGMTRPERIFQVCHPDLISHFPPLQSLSRQKHNLPAMLNSFVGRKREKENLVKQLQNARLVTLVGSGGVGKSRLAIETAYDLLESYPDGIWLVELASISNPDLIPTTIGKVLGIVEERNRPLVDTIFDYLRPKKLLLILDNCEHLITAIAELASLILDHCPNLYILVSSREAISVEGETAIHLPSLTIPRLYSASMLGEEFTPAELMHFEAVELFVERAKAVRSGFELNQENSQALIQIVRRLDGIPLAIELAAARVRVLELDQIAARLDNAFHLLTGGSRIALPRQQTLRATIEWSYNLLSTVEQVLFRRLAVFTGGWTLDAAEAICADPILENNTERIGDHPANKIDPEQILDLLTLLADKSLVNVEHRQGLETRYRLLETVRQYAREMFSRTSEAEYIRQLHHNWFVEWVETGVSNQKGPKVLEWMDRLEADFDNLRAALAWASDKGFGGETALRLASGLHRYWWMRGNVREGFDWLKRGLDLADLPAELAFSRVRALYTAAWVAGQLYASDEARYLAAEAVISYRELGKSYTDGLVEALSLLAMNLINRENLEKAHSLSDEAVELGRRLGKSGIWSLAMALWVRSLVALNEKNLEIAFQDADESYSYFLQANDPWNAGPLLIKGNVAMMQNDFEQAHDYLTQAITRFSEARDRGGMVSTYNSLSFMAILKRDFQEAAGYFKEGVRLWNEMGNRLALVEYLVETAFLITVQLADLTQENADFKIRWSIRLWAAAFSLNPETATTLDKEGFTGWWLRIAESVRNFSPHSSLDDTMDDLKEKVQRLCEDIEENEFAAAVQEGKAMNLEQAVSFATKYGWE
jgi:predicted ATPase/class 3 adenylate cyclase/tetratricopeptide (TPR) repeat protein